MVSLNSFITYLENKIPLDLDKVSKAKYIYIQLGEIISFDPSYLLGTSKERYNIYNSIIYKYEYLNNLFERKFLICRSIAFIYKYVLNEFKIESDIYYESPNDNHVLNIITIENNIKISADLQKDLEFIQTKSMTRFFNIVNSDCVYEKLEIDKKIRYINNETDYFDFEIDNLKNNFETGVTLEDKIIFIFNFLYSHNNFISMGISESIKFCKYILKENLTNNEFAKLSFSICYKIFNEIKQYISVISIHPSTNCSNIFICDINNHNYDLISDKNLLLQIKNNKIFIQNGTIYITKKQITRTTNINNI
jgi:hypothetical protein